jgi:hypothetical protein
MININKIAVLEPFYLPAHVFRRWIRLILTPIILLLPYHKPKVQSQEELSLIDAVHSDTSRHLPDYIPSISIVAKKFSH